MSSFRTASPQSPSGLSSCAVEVRRSDHDRFLTCLFAPAERREALFAVLAFNSEIAKTREVIKEPIMGQIRLQWWRDTIEALYRPGAVVPAHEVAQALAGVVTRHRLSQRHFETLIDAREADLEDQPPASFADLEAYAEATGAPVVALALEALAFDDGGGVEAAAADAGRHVGIAWALTGVLRAVPFHAAHGRVVISADLLKRHGLSAEGLTAWRPGQPVPALAGAVAEVAALAGRHLEQARRLAHNLPRGALPALMPATLAELYLGVLARANYDVFNPKVQRRHPWRPLALAWRAWRGVY